VTVNVSPFTTTVPGKPADGVTVSVIGSANCTGTTMGCDTFPVESVTVTVRLPLVLSASVASTVNVCDWPDDGEHLRLEVHRCCLRRLTFEQVCDLHEAVRGGVGGDDLLRLSRGEPKPFQRGLRTTRQIRDKRLHLPDLLHSVQHGHCGVADHGLHVGLAIGDVSHHVSRWLWSDDDRHIRCRQAS
jgi:hypothetical protein